jgi:PAS domain S-box-containing protein
MAGAEQTGQGITAGQAALQSLLDAIVELSSDAIFTCDKTGRITSWGAASERLCGYDASHAIGAQVESLFTEHLRQEIVALMTFAMAGERIRRFESEILRPDGMPLPVSLSLCRIVDERGEFIGSVLIARDVTEQLLAQATLAEVDARVEDSEALTHVGSWMWDVRTGAVQWSTEFYRLHGVDPLEFGGTLESYLEVVDEADRADMRSAMEAAVRTGTSFEMTYRIAHPLTPGATVQVRARPTFGSAGMAIGLRGIGSEVRQATP